MIKVVLLKKMKMVEMILMGVMAFLVAVRWFLMLTIKQNITKIINFPRAFQVLCKQKKLM